MKIKIFFQVFQRGSIFAFLIFGAFPILVHAGGRVAVWGDNASGQRLLPNGLDNVKAFAAGSAHSLALKSDGTVVAWGDSDSGAVTVPTGLAGVKEIAAGGNWNLALKTDGTVVGWGAYNSNLRVSGLSNVVGIAAGWYHWLVLKSDGGLATWSAGGSSYTPTNLPSGLANVAAIATGLEFSLALKADGTVSAWGWNEYGQTNVPVGLSNVIAIATSAASSHCLALRADGTVVAWGANWEGQSTVPTNLTNVIAVAAGHSHSLALKADGSVVAWGNATGTYPNNGQSIVPPGLSNVKAIAAGHSHSLALVFNGPPEILTQPGNTEIFYQSNLVLAVAAKGDSPLGYQWYLNNNALTDSDRVLGSKTSSLSISNAQFADAGTYRLVVSNALGMVTSTGAVLTVISPPFIVQQPQDRTVRAGSDVTFMAYADGTAPLRYQWNFNGAEISGGTNFSLTLFNVQQGQSGFYHMRVTNLYGQAVTVRASLTVTDTPPYFLSLPAGRVVGIGGSTVLQVTARGSMPLSYQWRLNGVDIPGGTNTTLSLSQMRYDQAGYYSVEVSNAFGSTNSPKIFVSVLQVLVSGTPGIIPPSTFGTNQPPGLSNVTAVAAGASFVMALKSDGTVRTWLEPAASLIGSPLGVTNIPASVTNIIAISAGYDHCLALRSNGTVVAWGGYSTQTNVPSGLSNVVAIAAGQNRSYAIKADGTVTGWGSQQLPNGLSNIVSMVCSSSLNFGIRRDGSVISWPAASGTFTVLTSLSNVIALAAGPSANLALRQDGTVWRWLSSGFASPVMNGNQLQSNIVAVATGIDLDMLLRSDGALILPGGIKRISFPVTNNITAIAAGGVQLPFGVAVIGDGALNFALQPSSQIVQRSNTVRLHARAVGAEPIRYQWLWDGVTLPGATNASLVISNFTGSNSGNYRMVASNALGVASSRIATISIPFNTNLPAALNATNLQWTTPDRTVPWFAQNRVTHDGDVAAQSGVITNNGSSALQAFVSTPGTLTFWWKVSSEEGFDFLRVYVDQSAIPLFSISGEADWEQRTITFTNGQSHQVRWVYSKDGSVSAGRDAGFLDEVKFTVPPPVVSIAPATLTVSSGGTASFFATTLSYDKPIVYQWTLNGTNLPGATNQTLSLANVRRKDRGAYAVRVANPGGSVLVSNAMLNVIVQQRMSDMSCSSNGCVEVLSRDADGSPMSEAMLPRFEAQFSVDLIHWQALSEPLVVTNGSFLLRDPEAARWPRRFYRMVER